MSGSAAVRGTAASPAAAHRVSCTAARPAQTCRGAAEPSGGESAAAGEECFFAAPGMLVAPLMPLFMLFMLGVHPMNEAAMSKPR